MEEARKLLERLERIERLERERAPARTILAEVRELLTEAERWARSEARGDERAAAAANALREALERHGEAALAPERTLVA